MESFTIKSNIIEGAKVKVSDYRDFTAVILESLNSEPNYVAQIDADTGKQTTFAEMKDRSIRCGLWLKRQGVGRGDIVAICTHNHLDCYIPIFAALYNGAIYSGWDHETTLESARYLMKLFEPKIMFSCEKTADLLAEAAKLERVSTKIIVFGRHATLESLNEILEQQSAEEVENYQPVSIANPKETTALIILTSGSTGYPKGVMHSYYNITKILYLSRNYPAKSVNLWYSTCYWITGFFFMSMILFSRATRIIHEKYDAEETCRLIEKYKVNFIFTSPLMIYNLCKLNVFQKYKLPSLKLIITGGLRINPNLVEEFQRNLPQVTITKVYGLSEVIGGLVASSKNCKNRNSNGFIASNTQIKIIDTTSGKALGPNKRGELCFKSPLMMMGYYKDPEKTKKAIDDEGWLHTDDLAYYDENGEIVVIDRISNAIKYQNRHIYPSEIEEILLKHPGVVEVAVVPISHKIDGERAVAFVKKSPTIEITANKAVELSSLLEENRNVLQKIVLLKNIPKLATNKFDKLTLIRMAKESMREE